VFGTKTVDGNLGTTVGGETKTAWHLEIWVTEIVMYETAELGTLTTKVDGTDDGTSENVTTTFDGWLYKVTKAQLGKLST